MGTLITEGNERTVIIYVLARTAKRFCCFTSLVSHGVDFTSAMNHAIAYKNYKMTRDALHVIMSKHTLYALGTPGIPLAHFQGVNFQ